MTVRESIALNQRFRLNGKVFSTENNATLLTKAITTELISNDDQNAKQELSLEEYSETHLQGKYPRSVLSIMKQFERFMACNILLENEQKRRQETRYLLDVGCGIGNQIPPYLQRIAASGTLQYVGLDPYVCNSEREFPFINGVFEGLHRHLETRFEFSVFSTSLDHMQDLDAVANELPKIMSAGGLSFFWSGLHDPDVIARQTIANSYAEFSLLPFVNVVSRIVLDPIRLFRLRSQILRRSIALKKNQPLDGLHYHYFQKDSLERFLSGIGSVVDKHFVPFSNSIFYAIKVNL